MKIVIIWNRYSSAKSDVPDGKEFCGVETVKDSCDEDQVKSGLSDIVIVACTYKCKYCEKESDSEVDQVESDPLSFHSY